MLCTVLQLFPDKAVNTFMVRNSLFQLGIIEHAPNPSTRKAEAGDHHKFEASLD